MLAILLFVSLKPSEQIGNERGHVPARFVVLVTLLVVMIETALTCKDIHLTLRDPAFKIMSPICV